MARSRVPQAAVAGIAAGLAALALMLAGVAPLDDRILAPVRRPAPASVSLLVVAPDADARGGTDAALLARLVSRASRAGAAVVVLDRALIARTDGPASEAILRHTVAQTDIVVLALAAGDTADAALPASAALGHALGVAERGVAAVPAAAVVGERRLPAAGLLAAARAMSADLAVDAEAVRLADQTIPVDRAGRARFSLSDGLPTVPLGVVLGLVERDDAGELQRLMNGKIVVVLSDPALTQGVGLQAELANALVTGSVLRAVPAAWVWTLVPALAIAVAWLWLARRWWVALAVTAGVALAVTALVAGLLRAGVLVPLTAPLTAMLAASLAGGTVRQLRERRRLQGLEGEVAAMREALVRHESTVETLEEDLEAARAAVERSTGAERELVRAAEALRAQLAEARAQEEETRRRLESLLRDSRAVEAAEPADAAADRVGIVTRDPAMLALCRDLERAARSSLPILLVGEPGTGKELFARAAHRLSARAAQPFVAVNMAAIAPDLFESELFGHLRGSFTGAVADRKGWLEQADRGTIFLDEIGDLRPDHQSKLLRALQEKTFYRVGATRATSVDVRVVAATNRDLERGVAEGWFREDLYFRLKGLVLRLPPLRARRGDIRLLADRLLEEAAAETKRPHLRLSEAALAALERHDWPGNVRELQNCLRQAAALAEGDVLGVADLRLPASRTPPERGDADATVLAVLRRQGFDMQATARALGWDRSTVTQHLKGLGFRALVEAGGELTRAAVALAGDAALARTVEVKLREYHRHLLRSVESFDSADAAVAACRRRFKNLPERHFRFLEALVRRHFELGRPSASGPA